MVPIFTAMSINCRLFWQLQTSDGMWRREKSRQQVRHALERDTMSAMIGPAVENHLISIWCLGFGQDSGTNTREELTKQCWFIMHA
jgi:hypothetical protein